MSLYNLKQVDQSNPVLTGSTALHRCNDVQTKPTQPMNHDVITHTPITMDNGNIVEAYVHKLPSGMYALYVEYNFKANANPTRIRQITESIWRNQYRDWFRFIRFQRSSTPLPMPTFNQPNQ